MKLEVKNLEKKFDNFTAVNNINFLIKEGRTLGLLGPNGCWKTTTIGMLLGLIKPSKGEILFDEKNFENFDREKILSKFQVNDKIMSMTDKKTVFMHCLPAKIGSEVTEEVIKGKKSIVLTQAKNRLVAQKGILKWLSV